MIKAPKSMAPIETTDEFFDKVTRSLAQGPVEDHRIVDGLDGLYQSLTGLKPRMLKSSLILWDVYEQQADDSLVDKIQDMTAEPDYNFLPKKIVTAFSKNPLYQQSVILFIYWMLLNRKRRLLKDWPFEKTVLEPFATDLGISTGEA